jgi:tetratricopeptide (TPR) repeat protein
MPLILHLMAGVISFAKYLKFMKQALLFLLVLVSLTACKRKEKKGEDKLYLQYTQYNEIVKKYGVATTDSIKLALDEYIKTFPADARAWAFYGRVFFDLKQYEQSIAAYQKAIALNPNMAEGYSGAGAIFGVLEKPDSSICYLNQAIIHNDSSAYTYMNLSLMYLQLDSSKTATSALADSALQKLPTAPVYAGISYVMNQLGEKTRSENLFQKAKELELRDTLGFTEVLAGKRKLIDYYTNNNY